MDLARTGDRSQQWTLQGTFRYLTCGGNFLDGGEFWTDEPDAEGIHEKVWYDDDGDQVEGRLLPANGVVAKVKHGFRYASREWTGGRRWTIACFTARSFPESSAKEKAGLRDCGFPVPDLRHICKGHEDQNDNGNKVHEFTTGHLPKHSIRKGLWKTAARLSTFLTWSVIALTSATGIRESHDGPRHVPRDQLPLLELGGWTETVEAAEILNDSYIHEPILWAGPGEPDVRTSLAEILKTKDPGVLWIHWPGARHAQDVGFFEILRDFVPIQRGRDRDVVIELHDCDDVALQQLIKDCGQLCNSVQHFHDEKPRLRLTRQVQAAQTYVTEGQAPLAENPVRTGARGITFDKTVKGDVAATLRRLHQNLGHPAPQDLARHLRLAGASAEVVKAAKSLHCETCNGCRGPHSAKPASEPKLLEFGDVVGVDMLFAYDINGKKHKFLSIIDHASSYHVTVRVKDQTGDTLEKVFLTTWIQVFGAPKVVTIDLETGIQDAFRRLADWLHIDLQTSAGQAHWQSGYVERHGKWWKEIFKKVVEEQSAEAGEMDLVAASVNTAKNNLRRRCGWAPTQIVFGRQPRDEDDLAGHELDTGDLVVQTADDAQHRREAIGTAAKVAFLKVRIEDKIRRGSVQRARVRPGELKDGSMVLFWRKDKNNKKGAWRGPGVVIGKQHENYWVSRGGRCYLCAPEHLRLAFAEELGGLFTLRQPRTTSTGYLKRTRMTKLPSWKRTNLVRRMPLVLMMFQTWASYSVTMTRACL